MKNELAYSEISNFVIPPPGQNLVVRVSQNGSMITVEVEVGGRRIDPLITHVEPAPPTSPSEGESG